MSIFGESWWLDAASDGAWGRVSVTEGDSEAASFPYARRTMARGIIRLGNPLLTPRLPLRITHPSDSKPATRANREIATTEELLSCLPRHHLFVGALDYDVVNPQPWVWCGFDVQVRASQIIGDVLDTERCWSDLAGSTRRAVRKAERSVDEVSPGSVDDLWTVVTSTFERQGLDVQFDRAVLERLHRAASRAGQGEILTARIDGQPVASVFIVWDSRRTTYLVGGADTDKRSSGAMSLLLWESIRRASSRSESFDFEGSMLPGVARFFRTFGAQPVPYLRVVGGSRLARVMVGAYESWRSP